jgi:hypothetical protein
MVIAEGAVMDTVKFRARTAMRRALIGLSLPLLLGCMTASSPALSEVSVTVSIPGASIGIHQPDYPELMPIPGYPVYYAPQAHANLFFYDGLYWVYHDDRWYSSAWYNGPWDLVDPVYVPLFVLRVPVRYYVYPPPYFHGWVISAPPRWDIHWGPRWAQHRHGWDYWDRRVVWHAAPPPAYQRHYSGDRYPRRELQHALRDEHYRYHPRDAAVRQRYHQERPAVQTHAPIRVEPPRRYELQRERSDMAGAAPVQTVPQPHKPAVFEQGRASPLDVERREHGDRGRREHVVLPTIRNSHVTPNPQPEQHPREVWQRPREEVQRHAPVMTSPQMQQAQRQPQPFIQQPAMQQRQGMGYEADRRQHEPLMQPYRERERQGRGNDQQRGHGERGR